MAYLYWKNGLFRIFNLIYSESLVIRVILLCISKGCNIGSLQTCKYVLHVSGIGWSSCFPSWLLYHSNLTEEWSISEKISQKIGVSLPISNCLLLGVMIALPFLMA